MNDDRMMRVIAGIMDQWHKGNIDSRAAIDMIDEAITGLYKNPMIQKHASSLETV